MLDVFLQPGEFYFGDRETCIRTLLGSCVAITMWHPRLRLGGMCHFMLPKRTGTRSETPDGRYADEALQLFQREIRTAGTRVADYQVKLFGGGDMFQHSASCTGRGDCRSVACKNVAAARALLRQTGFNEISAEHVGRHGHRNVIFEVWSGDIWVRHNWPVRL